jgi:hypothetical protein
MREGQSLMDAIRGDMKRLRRGLNAPDQSKLDSWVSSVRGLEKTLQTNAAWIERSKPTVEAKAPSVQPNNAVSGLQAMLDLAFLAFQTDSTRFATIYLPGHEAVTAIQGVTQGYHELSHHGLDRAKLTQLALVEQTIIDAWARFPRKLKGAKLLGETMVLLTSNLGNASNHDTRNMPVLFAGGGFRHGQHLAFDQDNNYPLARLFISAMRRLGMPDETFSNTSGEMIGLT